MLRATYGCMIVGETFNFTESASHLEVEKVISLVSCGAGGK